MPRESGSPGSLEDADREPGRRLGRRQARRRLLRLADGAAGNPLYVAELVAALTGSAEMTVREAGGRRAGERFRAASLWGNRAPARLCNREVRRVLRAAAMLGVDFAVPDLATVLGRSVSDLIPAIDEACTAGVLADLAAASGSGTR